MRVTACSGVPGGAPPTAKTTRTGAASSVRGFAASVPAVTTSVRPAASMSAALSMRNWARCARWQRSGERVEKLGRLLGRGNAEFVVERGGADAILTAQELLLTHQVRSGLRM